MRNFTASAFTALLFSTTAFAATPNAAIQSNVPNAQLVGSGTYEWVMWDAYEASLYAPDGAYSRNSPYALRIKYLVEINGEDIAERSIKEIKKQGYTNKDQLTAWDTELKAIFPDVKEGTALTAIRTEDDNTVFYNGDTQIGEIQGKEFARYFFGIWLGDKSEDPELTKALLGK